MRTLDPAPTSLLDDHGAPRFGSYRGALPPVDLTSLARRSDLVTKRKRWLYVSIATADVYIAAAGIHLGYATQLFAFVYDRKERRMLADRSAMGAPVGQRFGRTPDTEAIALKALGGSFELMPDPGDPRRSRLAFEIGDVRATCELDGTDAPSPIGVVAKIPGGVVDATEKRALLRVKKGSARVGAREIDLAGAIAGYDYTHGLLARRTAWRWSYGLGHAKTGERVAWNLVEGFVGEPECALWIDGELHGVGVGQFTFDAAQPLERWAIKSACGAVDVTFAPGALHAEKKDFGVVASRFVQPVGVYRGALRVGERTLEIEDVLGVAEDQDVLW
ncbi:MAG TPA: DUF2804 domain-containing protein [Byssovorax sp.]